jgi:hypothetical protein
MSHYAYSSPEAQAPDTDDRVEVVHVGEKRYFATTFLLTSKEDALDVAETVTAAVKTWQKGGKSELLVEVRATPFEGHAAPGEGNWIFIYQEIPPDVNPDTLRPAAIEMVEDLASII